MECGLTFLFLFVVVALIIVLIIALQSRSRALNVQAELKRHESRLLELKRELHEFRELLEKAVPGSEFRVPRSEEEPVAETPTVEVPEPQGIETPSFVERDTLPAERDTLPAEPVPPIEQPLPPPQPPPPPPPTRSMKSFDWEGLVGVKLFSWIAGIALALAAVFFLRYSIDHGWLIPKVRMALGLITGVGLLILCELRIANRYRITANAFDAAGVAILYATLFASNVLWHLLPSVVAFLLMVLVTGVAVLLSIRRDSVFIALLGLVGGFATPALLSTGEDRPITLFGYLLMVNAGLAWVAFRKRWPVLMGLSLAFTLFYQWGWVMKFLDARRLPLAASIFIAFPLLSVGAYLLSSWSRREDSEGRPFERTAALSAVLPMMFALYGAAVPAYGGRLSTLFAFVLCLDAGLAFIAAQSPRLGGLHAIGGYTTLAVFVIWITVSYTTAAWPSILIWTAVFVLFYYAVPMVADRIRPMSPASRDTAVVGSLLLFLFPTLAFIEKATASPALLFGTLLALTALAGWFAYYYGKRRIWYFAAFFVLGAETVWTTHYLEAERLNPALLIYGAFALLFLALPLLAQRAAAPDAPSRFRNAARLALTPHLFLLVIASERHLVIEPWPMLTLLILLTFVIGIAALSLRDARVHAGSLLLSQLILMQWERSARYVPWPTIALLMSLGLVAFSLIWMFAWKRFFLSRTLALSHSQFTTAAIVNVFAAELVLIAASVLPGAPPFGFLLAAQVILTASLLWIAAATEWHAVAVIAVLPAALAAFVLQSIDRDRTRFWTEPFLFALVTYGLFIAYPLVLGARAGKRTKPYLAAVLASVPFFFLARQTILDAGYESVIGILPVAQAAILLALLVRLLRLEPRAERATGRLALVAAAALAFLTVAIPLQLEKEWITIGFALEGAALAWLYTRIPHRGLLRWSFVLLTVVFARLVLNDAVFSYHPRSTFPILNWYLYTYLVTAAAFFVAAYFFRRTEDRIAAGLPRLSSILPAGAAVLLFLLLNIEIADFYSKGATLTFNFFHASLAQELSYTLGWAVFAIGMLVCGIIFSNRVARVAAILLLILTIFKCFVHDLGRLGGLYRVGSFVGLAICLALVALLLQRFVMTPQLKEEAPR